MNAKIQIRGFPGKSPKIFSGSKIAKIMKTLVKFLKNGGEVFAFFPSLNYNKAMYGNSMKMSYAHVGQHSSCHVDYAAESTEASKSEYAELEKELTDTGYDLKVLNMYSIPLRLENFSVYLGKMEIARAYAANSFEDSQPEIRILQGFDRMKTAARIVSELPEFAAAHNLTLNTCPKLFSGK